MNLLLLLTLTWVSCCLAVSSEPADGGFKFIHHDHQATVALMHTVSEKCPDITRIYNLSETSVEGRPLTVIELTQEPGKHVPKKPEFKYVGNMHGNEVVGKEVLLRLMLYLCERHLEKDKTVAFLLSHTRLHILPSMNPDGWHKAHEEFKKTVEVGWVTGRTNANGVDLNRNFPDLDKIMFENMKSAPGHNNHLMTVQKAFETFSDLQPETRAVMRWLSEVGFVLSANLHEGDLVANYPYDVAPPQHLASYSATPDDSTFIELAKSYSFFHGKMSDPNHKLCSPDERFKDGITNGDAWYPVRGGMQDYNYLQTNCFEITLELSCNKFPPKNRLQAYWQDNMWALLNFMLHTHMGIKGTVRSSAGHPIPNAVIQVTHLPTGNVINHDILSLSDGDYYRLLSDGHYKVTARAQGHGEVTRCVSVKNGNYVGASVLRPAQEVDFVLPPESQAHHQGDAHDAHCRLLSWAASQEQEKVKDGDGAESDSAQHDADAFEDDQKVEEEFLEAVLSYLDRHTQWRSSSLKPSVSRLHRILSSELSKLSPGEQDRLMDIVLTHIQGNI